LRKEVISLQWNAELAAAVAAAAFCSSMRRCCSLLLSAARICMKSHHLGQY
jgi:hypothetical protein